MWVEGHLTFSPSAHDSETVEGERVRDWTKGQGKYSSGQKDVPTIIFSLSLPTRRLGFSVGDRAWRRERERSGDRCEENFGFVLACVRSVGRMKRGNRSMMHICINVGGTEENYPSAVWNRAPRSCWGYFRSLMSASVNCGEGKNWFRVLGAWSQVRERRRVTECGSRGCDSVQSTRRDALQFLHGACRTYPDRLSSRGRIVGPTRIRGERWGNKWIWCGDWATSGIRNHPLAHIVPMDKRHSSGWECVWTIGVEEFRGWGEA